MNYSLGNMLSRGGALNPDGLSLDLAFAADKTLTARRGPTPTFTRASTATFVGSDGLIQSAAINAARFDHDPVTGICRGLLIEESRGNLISFSESINNSAWNAFATAAATDNQTTSPSGVAASASRLTAIAGTSTVRGRVRVLGITTGGSAYSASAFIKPGTSNFGFVDMAFNKVGVGAVRNCTAHIVFSTGVVTKTGTSNANFTVTSTPYPDGWYRITISGTSNASLATEDQVVISLGISFNGVGGSGTFAGTETVFGWGAQLEAGSFPTSYIPTTTTALTRSADVCSITGADFTSFYNQSEGTLFAECQAPTANQYAGIAVIGTTSFSHNIALFKSNTTGGTVGSRFVPYVTQAGSLVALYDFGDGSGNGNLKVLASVALNNMIFARNGTLSPVDSSATMPTPNRIIIGGRADGNYLNGHIARIQYFRKRLPNAKLQSLTAP